MENVVAEFTLLYEIDIKCSGRVYSAKLTQGIKP